MRLRRAALVCAALIAVSACSSATSTGDDVTTTRGSTVTTRARVASTTTTEVLPEVQVPVELASFDEVTPHPEPSPDDPRAAVAIDQIGTIRIPAIGLDHAIYEGVWLTVLDEGPGHWPGSALPGERGNATFPGHRVTHSHPFLDLDRLKPGDEIFFDMHNGTFTYRVRETLIVKPSDVWVVDQSTSFEATLIACHPKHSARQRIVVKADLVGSRLNDEGNKTLRSLQSAFAAASL